MITLDLFCKKLATVNEAISSKGKTYTNVKLEDTVITFQRTPNKRECIAINELYEVYMRESWIDTAVLKKYLSNRASSPAFAVLLASGIYDKNGNRVTSTLKERNFKNSASILKKLFYTICHAFPIILVIGAIFMLSPDSDRYNTANILIGIIIFIVSVSFFVFVLLYKRDSFTEATYTSYFTLLIFIIGIFPFYNFVKEYMRNLTPEIAYTSGFRAWGSQIEIYDINISYYDDFGYPKSLPFSVVNDSNNWLRGFWDDYNSLNNFELVGNARFINKHDTLSIILTNSGVVLKPEVFKGRVSDFMINAKIKYLKKDPAYKKLSKIENYPSVQLCIKVPVDLSSNKPNEIYYAHEFFFQNYTWSKLRIPGFNFDFNKEQLFYRLSNNKNDENAKQIVLGIDSTIFYNKLIDSIPSVKIDSIVHLSALIFSDNALFNIHKKNSSHTMPLFKFNLSQYGAFILKEK